MDATWKNLKMSFGRSLDERYLAHFRDELRWSRSYQELQQNPPYVCLQYFIHLPGFFIEFVLESSLVFVTCLGFQSYFNGCSLLHRQFIVSPSARLHLGCFLLLYFVCV